MILINTLLWLNKILEYVNAIVVNSSYTKNLLNKLSNNFKNVKIIYPGINIKKNPIIKGYLTVNLSEFSRKKINKNLIYRSIKINLKIMRMNSDLYKSINHP